MSAKVTFAIAALIEETALNTVNALEEEMKKRFEFDPEMNALFDHFKENLKVESKIIAKTKQTDLIKKNTRKPSKYNEFISETMARLKTEGHKGNLMLLAVKEWNALKTMNTNPTFEVEEDYE